MEEATSAISETMVTPTFKQKVKIFFSRRRNVVLSGLLVLIIVLVSASLMAINLLTKPSNTYKAPQEYVNEDLKPEVISEDSQEVTVLKGYDLVYLASDKELYAATQDASTKVKITKTNGNVLDFIISPDRKNVAYAVTEPDYKKYIKSRTINIYEKNIKPIPTRIYEFDISTGENKLVWQISLINLKNSDEYVENTFYPVSYWYNSISYPMSYTRKPASYPGNEYMPFDVARDLEYKTAKLLTYNSDGSKILFQNNGIYIYDKSISKSILTQSTITTVSIPCIPSTAQWEGKYISIDLGCFEGMNNQLYVEANNQLNRVDSIGEYYAGYGGSKTIYTLLSQEKAVLFQSEYGANVNSNQIQLKNLINSNEELSLKGFKNEYLNNLEGKNIVNNNLVYLLSSDYQGGKHLYAYNTENNTITKISDLNVKGYNNITQANLNKSYDKLLLTAPQSSEQGSYHWSILVYDISTGQTTEIATKDNDDDNPYSGYYQVEVFKGFWL